MKLANKAKKLLNENNAAKARLCAAFDASYDTVQRWIRKNDNDSKLTTLKAVRIISEEIRMPEDQILS